MSELSDPDTEIFVDQSLLRAEQINRAMGHLGQVIGLDLVAVELDPQIIDNGTRERFHALGQKLTELAQTAQGLANEITEQTNLSDERIVTEDPQEEPQVEESRETGSSTHDQQVAAAEIDLSPAPHLSRAQQNAEQLVLRLLRQPNLSFTGRNVGAEMRHIMGLSPSEWGNLKTTLEASQVIATERASARRSTAIMLNLEALFVQQAQNKPFVTERVLDVVKRLASQAPETKPVAEVSVPVSGQQPDTPQMSARVRKALVREADGRAGYKKLPEEPQPFLEHRRQRTGAKRRH